MIMRPTLVAAFVLAAAASVPAAAQDGYAIGLQPGAEVRFSVRGSDHEVIRGRAVRIDGDTLVVASGALAGAAPRRVLLTDLATLQVRGGRDRRRGVVIGAVGLGVVTGVAGGIDYAHNTITFGDFIGTLAGNVALGAGVGYLLAPTGWFRLPLPGH
ncbi:MAG: hypothetical protein JWN79_2583 [Gemmatimonadetes bacterium]|jgi:hypothetical protein|nr:hypothetical protein [Gemmatimonadota bacterium]